MRLVVCLGALGVLACAGNNPPPEGGTRTMAEVQGAGRNGAPVILERSDDLGALYVVQAPIDSAFRAIAGAYVTEGLALATRDAGEHVVGATRKTVMHAMLGRPLSAFFDCGSDPTIGVPRADRYRITFSARTTLMAADSSHTRVTTMVSAVAADLATSATPVECESTGALERILLHAAGFQAG